MNARISHGSRIWPAGLLALLLLWPAGLGLHAAAPRGLQAGEPAPAFQTQDLAGNAVELADLRGEWVLLNFWATWCVPCIKEFPSMQRLAQKMAGEPFRIVALNVMDSRARIQGFLKRHKLDLPIWRDRDGGIHRKYRVRAFPTSVLVGPDGTVLSVHEGAATWDAPRRVAQLRHALGKAP